MRENLAPLFATPAASGFGIGLLHANVGGNTDHDPYAPCSVSDLVETGLDYWALGHVHTRQVLREEQPTIVYPGNPQGRNPRETGERGIYLVEVNDYGAVSLDFRPVDVVRWDSLEVGIEGMETQQELLDAIDYAVAGSSDSSGRRPVVYRLTIMGRGPLNRWIRSTGTLDDLLEQVNDQHAHALPWLWCERIQVDTGSPVDREHASLREDFAGDLARLTSSLLGDSASASEIRELLRPLYVNSNAAAYLREFLPNDEEAKAIGGLR